jgi:hypothetical protein
MTFKQESNVPYHFLKKVDQEESYYEEHFRD